MTDSPAHYPFILSAYWKAMEEYPLWGFRWLLCNCAECRSAYASGWAERLNEEMRDG